MRSLLSHSDHKLAGLRSTLSKVTEELWTELRSQRQLSETIAVVMATPTHNIANTPALADVRDEFLEVAAGTLNPCASPAAVRTVLDTVLARSGLSFYDLSSTTESTGMFVTSTVYTRGAVHIVDPTKIASSSSSSEGVSRCGWKFSHAKCKFHERPPSTSSNCVKCFQTLLST